MTKEVLETHPQTPTRTIAELHPETLLRRLLATIEGGLNGSDFLVVLEAIRILSEYNLDWGIRALSMFEPMVAKARALDQQVIST